MQELFAKKHLPCTGSDRGGGDRLVWLSYPSIVFLRPSPILVVELFCLEQSLVGPYLHVWHCAL